MAPLLRPSATLALACCVFWGLVSGAQAAARVPELVSNTDTNGSDVRSLLRTSADGRSMAWASLGAYAGTKGANGAGTYVGRRTDQGWSVTPHWPDVDLVRPGFTSLMGGWVFPADLSSMLAVTFGPFDPDDADFYPGSSLAAVDVYRFDAGGGATWLSRPQGVPDGLGQAKIVGASEDGSSVFFTHDDPLTADVPAGVVQLYRWKGGTVEAVGQDASGNLLTSGPTLGNGTTETVASGGGSSGTLPDSAAVSNDGSRFVYRDVSYPGYAQAFLHEDGVGVRQISLSQRAGSIGQPAPTGVVMVAATSDLRFIFLQSPDQLTDDAPAGGGDYVYDTTDGTLTFSNPDDSSAAGSQAGIGTMSGLVKVSGDAGYVYFLSTTALDPAATAGGRNLYVRHGGETTFIATLDPTDKDDGLGVLPLTGQPSYPGYTQSGISRDGKRLAFLSTASLGGFATAGHRAVYVYDAETSTLECPSCRADGSPSGGDARFGQTLDEAGVQTAVPRVISDDGRTVAFTTTDQLVPADVNDQLDVYTVSGKTQSLVSSGRSRFPTAFGGMSPDAVDLYFLTRDSLSSEDRNNGFVDLYDARVGGRIAPEEDTATTCVGDDCQGPAGLRSGSAVPSSSALSSSGDAGPSVRPVAKFKVRALSAAQRRALATRGTVTLTVEVSEPGRITARLRASVKGRSVQVASASKTAGAAGTVRLPITLTRAARSALSATGKLPVSVSINFSKVRTIKTVKYTLKRAVQPERNGARR
jgi:hypothetical protein